MIKKVRKLQGGYAFKNYAGQPAAQLLEVDLPAHVVVPMKQGFGREVKPLVKKGDTVAAGQIIGRDDETISSPVHSPVHGVVENIAKLNYGEHSVMAVFIRATTQSREIQRLSGYTKKWEKLSPEKLEELLYLSGVTALDEQGIPTRFKSSIILPAQVKDIIIHGVDSEPYNVSQELLLQGENFSHFLEGVKILKKIMAQSKIHIAINARKSALITQLAELSSELPWLDVYPLSPKYPQQKEECLISTILERKFPYTYSAANIGVIVLNIQTVLSIYQAVAEGLPVVERIIALCGHGFKENTHLKVRLGTPLAMLLDGRLKTELSSRLVLNSLLNGVAVSNLSLPVEKTTAQLIALKENKDREFLAFIRPGIKRDSYSASFLAKWLPGLKKCPDTNQHGEERVCISCGYCADVCPVRIIPHLISKYVQIDMIDDTIMHYGIFNCIDCGLCSFVCPSKLSLLTHIKKGREKLIEEGCGPEHCILPHFELTGVEEYRGVKKL